MGRDGTAHHSALRRTTVLRGIRCSALPRVEALCTARRTSVGYDLVRLGHVAVLVRDVDEMVAFYVDVVGLQVSEAGTGGGLPDAPPIAFLSWDPRTLHHQLALLEVRPDPSAPRNVHHVAFEVDTLDDLRPIWKRACSDGRAGSLQPGADGPVTAFMGDQWSIRFTDPEGNGVEVYAPTPWDTPAAAKPYSRSPTLVFEPFDLDLDNDALVAWGTSQLDALGMEHWPRGQRPWPRTVQPRASR
jgi:catechol 2,3-dioxygenase-like lactoylglutathione lyase family enzyme